MSIEVIFLGSGTSHGVPMIGCSCHVCTSADPKDKRLRSSILVKTEGQKLLIDTGPDLRTQLLREEITALSAVLLTHEHRDHIAGLDDLRVFSYGGKGDFPLYCTARVQSEIRRAFFYLFENSSYPGLAKIEFHDIPRQTFTIDGQPITPIFVKHHLLEVVGFRFGDFAYITDVSAIPQGEFQKLRGLKVLVLGALRQEPHISHFSLKEAVEVAKVIGAEKTYFTHVSHQMGRHKEVNLGLPEGMNLAHDGLRFTL